jgi:hypothetical protein
MRGIETIVAMNNAAQAKHDARKEAIREEIRQEEYKRNTSPSRN